MYKPKPHSPVPIVSLLFASLLIPLLFTATPAQARNFVSNGGFPTGLAGWTQEAGAWVHNAGDGVLGLGSAQTTSASAGTLSLTQCADVSTVAVGATVSLAGFVKAADHSAPVLVEIDLFSSANCSGGVLDTASQTLASPASGQWSLIYVPVEIPAGGAMSAVVRLATNATAGNQTTRFDAVSLRPDVIVDGHYNDDLSTWAQTPPGSWTLVNDGYSDPKGAAQATVSANGSVFLAQCVALENFPEASLYIGGIKIKALDELVDYVLSFQFWDSTSCSPPGTLFSPPQGLLVKPSQLNTWQSFLTAVPRPPGSRSVAVFVALNPGAGTPDTSFLVDDYVLLVGDQLLTDGFESGDTSVWSGLVP